MLRDLVDRDGCQPGEVRLRASKVLVFGSNDYLDLITHPQVKEAAVQAIRKDGSGCAGHRTSGVLVSRTSERSPRRR